jgi:hypothetical protein
MKMFLLGEAPSCVEPPVQRLWLVEALLLQQQQYAKLSLLQLFEEGLHDALHADLQAL